MGLDLLLGGIGADTLQGNEGNDLLVADRTVHDLNAAALMAIQAEWTSTASYAFRVLHLSGLPGGLNGANFLRVGTDVFDDGAADHLSGGTLDVDWFLYNLMQDVLADHEAGELQNDTFGT